MHADISATVESAATSLHCLRRWWAISGLILFAATWKLWTPQDVFPQVPLFRWVGAVPVVVEWLCCAIVLGSLAAAVLDRWKRSPWLAFATALGVLILIDQHRLQPWAWQLLLMSCVFVSRNANTNRLLMLLTISVYFWSAVSKCDRLFFATHGQTLAEALFQSLGVNTAPWPPAVKGWLAVALPAGEMLVALGLSWPRTRRVALWSEIGLHVSLIMALGPFGLQHRPGVLFWNLAFIGHDWLLFGHSSRDRERAVNSRCPTPSRSRLGLSRVTSGFATVLIVAASVWPLTEPLGFCDHWLAWSVYSTRTERVSVTLSDEGLQDLPEPVRRLTVDGELVLDRWSIEALDVPIYPQWRFQWGIVEWLRRHAGEDHVLEITLIRPASRLQRDFQTQRIPGDQFDERRNEFWLNSRPR